VEVLGLERLDDLDPPRLVVTTRVSTPRSARSNKVACRSAEESCSSSTRTPRAGGTMNGGSNSTGNPGSGSRVRRHSSSARPRAIAPATRLQSRSRSAEPGIGVATSSSSKATRTVTGVNGSSAPVRTRRLVPSNEAVHGSSSPRTHSARNGSAGRLTTTDASPIDICQPAPTTSHHHRVSPGSPGSNTSAVDETIR
jgi:hypothetical protein